MGNTSKNKPTINQMERNSTGWKEIFTNLLKDQFSKHIRNFYNSRAEQNHQNQKPYNVIKNWAKDLSRPFSKKDARLEVWFKR
jgi:hypothetical protein